MISAALEKEKKVALPRCEDRFGQMTFRLIRDVGELTPGIFGSPEPSETALRVSDTDLSRPDAFALIPALAYDREGYRLGYGKGYYDRFLSASAEPLPEFFTAICFSISFPEAFLTGRSACWSATEG